MTQTELTQPHIEALDLFCGAGGLSYGLKQAGISVTAGLDFDRHCEYPFTENIGGAFLGCDLTTASSADLKKHFSNPRYKLIAGCAPCQPFSTLRNGSDRKKSTKWPLLREFSRVVTDIRPDIVTMENVPVLQKQEIFEEFTSDRLCCTNRVRDSCRESSVVAAEHEQTHTHSLQDQKLAGV